MSVGGSSRARLHADRHHCYTQAGREGTYWTGSLGSAPAPPPPLPPTPPLHSRGKRSLMFPFTCSTAGMRCWDQAQP